MVTLTKMQIMREDNLFNSKWTIAFQNDVNGNPTYLGEAEPGSLKGELKWRIKKLTYSGTAITDIQWASGSRAFDKEWDERVGYVYS